jgi:hypothetical protein
MNTLVVELPEGRGGRFWPLSWQRRDTPSYSSSFWANHELGTAPLLAGVRATAQIPTIRTVYSDSNRGGIVLIESVSSSSVSDRRT